MKKIYGLRKDYTRSSLRKEDLRKSPFDQFADWFQEAEIFGIDEPNIMTLATASPEGKPSARIVLLKSYSQKGFTFFTNYTSKKGLEIKKNPHAALVFLWLPMERQVRIEGLIEKVSDQESDEYFSSRPKGSRLGAWASPQSQEISSYESLLNLQKEQEAKFNENIPRPTNWGGFILKASLMEFWQGRSNRLHDRFEYQLTEGKWKIRRLAP